MQRVGRVLPDVPAVDRAFDYLVPNDAPHLRVGSIVRVPLHGRRVRGWVLELDVEPETAPDRLLPMRAVVSDGPPADLVALSAWIAWRWAGSRALVLRACSPPNIVTPAAWPEPDVAVFPPVTSPVELHDAPRRVTCWPAATPRDDMVRALLAPEGSTIVIVPDSTEAAALALRVEADGRKAVLVSGDQTAAARTEAWREARRGACVVIGGRVAALSPVPDLAAAVVLDDADEALKEERVPAWHASTVVVERARRADARFDVVSPVPTPEALTIAGDIVRADHATARAGWPRIEVADLRDEAPGVGLLSDALSDALRRAIDDGGRAVCVLNRRGRARLLACRTCREVARCAQCGAAVADVDGHFECARCGDTRSTTCASCGGTRFRVLRPGVVRVRADLAGLVPRALVVAVDAGSAPVPAFDIAVGTEAVLHRAMPDADHPVRLIAFLDFDQELLAPRYRAAEQASFLLVRAARLVGAPAQRSSILVQTRVPDHPVLEAARGADLLPVAEAELARRRALGFPPFGGLAAVTGDVPAVERACADLREDRFGLEVLGPVDATALVRSPTTPELCDALASIDVSDARAVGRVRIEVDPLRV